MKNYTLYIILATLLMVACVGKKNESNTSQSGVKGGYLQVPRTKLEALGVFIRDQKVMYNNRIEGVGSLNIIIRDQFYATGYATTPQTQYSFYPRYITNLDTIQRFAYRLEGADSTTFPEGRKWGYFEKLVPVVVEQNDEGREFGETLVFWFTRNEELLRVLDTK
jgi:hypothetical protein